MTAESAPRAGKSDRARMSRKAGFVLVVGLALAAGFAGRTLFVSGPTATSGSDVVELRRRVAALESARAEPRAASPSDREPVAADERQAEQDRRIVALESNVAFALKRMGDGAADAASVDETAADPEARRLRGLANPALFEEIRVLSSTQWPSKDEAAAGLAKTLQACDVFLARKTEPARRAEVLTDKGIAHRSMGDFEKAEATMREALALVSPTSDEGVTAAIQLAFNSALRYEPRTAADRFLAIALQPGMPPVARAQCRYRAANSFMNAHDFALAREHYGAVFDEFGKSDDKMARYWADESRKEIEKLDQGAGER